MRGITATAMGVVLTLTGAASAERFSIPINTAQSTVSVTLTLQGRSATDTSPVSGFFAGELRSVNTPTELYVSDFDLTLTETLVLNISFGFLGSFNSTVTGFQLQYAQPGVDVGPSLLSMGSFQFSAVPANLFGMLNYNATGLVCTALQGSMLPCVATQDLSQQNPVSVDTLTGTITSAARVVTLVSSLDQTEFIDPLNPSLGTIRVVGTIRGSVTVPEPCPGDADGDGMVGLSDIAAIINNWAQDGAPRRPGDLDEDGLVGIGDLAQVIENWEAAC